MLLVLLALKRAPAYPRNRFRASTSCVHACTPLLHACIGLVLACLSANMRASGSCWLVRRQARVHRSRAGLFIGKHACTVAYQFSGSSSG